MQFSIIIIISLVAEISTNRQVCLACNHVPLPQDCSRVVSCGEFEECTVDRYITPDGNIYFNVGCKDSDSCGGRSLLGSPIGKRYAVEKKRAVSDITVCHECCDGSDLCNVKGLCGAKPLDTNNGTICYHCTTMARPDQCNLITLCSSDEMCVVKEKKTELSQRTVYESGCAKRSTCKGIHGADCCEGDLCNNEFKCMVKLTLPPKMSKPQVRDGDIKFNCSFDFHDKDTSFEVSWTVDGSPLLDFSGNPIVKHLHNGERSATLDADKLAGNLNKMLRCKVVPKCSTGVNIDGGLQSNGYWVGMKVTPMRVDHKLIEILEIQSTLPFLCGDGTENNCSPEIVLHEYLNKTSGCRYKFQRNNQTGSYKTVIVLHLRPHSTLTAQNKVTFHELKDMGFPAWNPYSVPVVQIGKYKFDEKYSVCEIQGKDIKTFSSRLLQTENAGHIVLYKNESPTIEVQAKRKHHDNDTITCAIVAREGNSAVQIDICDQTQIVPVITYLPPSSNKKIFIDQSADGLNFKIHLLTGSTIVVNVTGHDLHTEMSFIERDVGHPGGLCGNSTGKHIPDDTHSTQTSLNHTESRYLQLWTRTEAESLFNKDIPFDANHTVHHGYCYCLPGSEVQCGTEL